VIPSIDSNTRHGSDNPPVGQWFRPERIDVERRDLAGHRGRLLREGKSRESEHGAGEQQNGGPKRV
jgi:hypothetical protein